MAKHIAVYEPESAGLITTLGRLRFALRVALTERDLLKVVREPEVVVAVIGTIANPQAAAALQSQLAAAAPHLCVVVAREGATTGKPEGGATTLAWPLDAEERVYGVIATLVDDMKLAQTKSSRASGGRNFPAVDWDSLDEITLSAPARSTVPGGGGKQLASAEVAERREQDDPWEVISTVVEHTTGSGPSTALEVPRRAPESFADCFADITRAVWAVRALTEASAMHRLSPDERAALSHHAHTLGTLLHQIGALIKHPPPEDP